MKLRFPLWTLPLGKSGIISSVNSESATAERIRNLGLTEGAGVRAVFFAPFGDPRAYEVNRSVVALRRKQASEIIVETEEEDGEKQFQGHAGGES